MPKLPTVALAVAGVALGAVLAVPTSRRQALRGARSVLDELAVRSEGPWSPHLLLLTTEGHRTRLPRTVVLSGVEHEGDTYVLPWLGRPAWLDNLRANPQVVVDDRRTVHRARAEVVEGDAAEAVRLAALSRLPEPLVNALDATGVALRPGTAAVRFTPAH